MGAVRDPRARPRASGLSGYFRAHTAAGSQTRARARSAGRFGAGGGGARAQHTGNGLRSAPRRHSDCGAVPAARERRRAASLPQPLEHRRAVATVGPTAHAIADGNARAGGDAAALVRLGASSVAIRQIAEQRLQRCQRREWCGLSAQYARSQTTADETAVLRDDALRLAEAAFRPDQQTQGRDRARRGQRVHGAGQSTRRLRREHQLRTAALRLRAGVLEGYGSAHARYPIATALLAG